MSEHLRSPLSMRRDAAADGGRLPGQLVSLWPCIWPSDRPDLQRRVLWSLVLLVAAKLATIAVPFTFKFATDGLAHEQDATGNSWIAWVIAAPLLMTAGYGGTRILAAGVTPIRDRMFPQVAMPPAERAPLPTLHALHPLTLPLHFLRN